MRTHSNNNEIYIGRKAGKEIFNTITNAKTSVKIVSPYLSPSYLEELVKLQKKGIKITLITADELREGNDMRSAFKHSDIIKQSKEKEFNIKVKNKRQKGIKISLIGILISFILLLTSLISSSLFYFSISITIISLISFFYYLSIKIYDYKYHSLFRIKVFDSHSGKNPQSTNLVHSKIFLIDENILFLGSANFTFSAFNTHYETVIRIKDEKAIKDISQEIENLYNSTELSSKSIDKWGKEIYEKWF